MGSTAYPSLRAGELLAREGFRRAVANARFAKAMEAQSCGSSLSRPLDAARRSSHSSLRMVMWVTLQAVDRGALPRSSLTDRVGGDRIRYS